MKCAYINDKDYQIIVENTSTDIGKKDLKILTNDFLIRNNIESIDSIMENDAIKEKYYYFIKDKTFVISNNYIDNQKLYDATKKIYDDFNNKRIEFIDGSIITFIDNTAIDLDILRSKLQNINSASIFTLEDGSKVFKMAKPLKGRESNNIRDNILFALGKKAKTEYENMLEKTRQDLTAEEKKDIIKYFEDLPDTKEDTAYIKTLVQWLRNNTVNANDILRYLENPEDNFLRGLFDAARAKGWDIQSFKDPISLFEKINSSSSVKKGEPIDPDTIPQFRKVRTEIVQGRPVTIYNVDDSIEGQTVVCNVLAASFPKDDTGKIAYNLSSPWCLSTFNYNKDTKQATPTQSAITHWKHYNKGKRQIAFIGNMPVAFNSSGESKTVKTPSVEEKIKLHELEDKADIEFNNWERSYAEKNNINLDEEIIPASIRKEAYSKIYKDVIEYTEKITGGLVDTWWDFNDISYNDIKKIDFIKNEDSFSKREIEHIEVKSNSIKRKYAKTPKELLLIQYYVDASKKKNSLYENLQIDYSIVSETGKILPKEKRYIRNLSFTTKSNNYIDYLFMGFNIKKLFYSSISESEIPITDTSGFTHSNKRMEYLDLRFVGKPADISYYLILNSKENSAKIKFKYTNEYGGIDTKEVNVPVNETFIQDFNAKRTAIREKRINDDNIQDYINEDNIEIYNNIENIIKEESEAIFSSVIEKYNKIKNNSSNKEVVEEENKKASNKNNTELSEPVRNLTTALRGALQNTTNDNTNTYYNNIPLDYREEPSALDENKEAQKLSLFEKLKNKGIKMSKSTFDYIDKLLEETDLAQKHYKYINSTIDADLEKVLSNILKEYHFEEIERPLKEIFGDNVMGAIDFLNKVIYYDPDRSALEYPEEFSHAFVKLMGSVYHKDTTKFPETKTYTELYNSVGDTQLYKDVFEKYKAVYKNPDGSPSLTKIKEEAIGQAISIALVDTWKNKYSKDATFFTKLKTFINKVLQHIKSKFLKQDKAAQFEKEIYKIANSILNGSYHRKYISKVDESGYNIQSWESAFEKLSKDQKTLTLLRDLSSKGMVISGSLSYRKQTPLYRPNEDSLHDFDIIIPDNLFAEKLFEKYPELKNISAEDARNISEDKWKEIINNIPYLKDLFDTYKDFHFLYMYPQSNKNGNIILNVIQTEDASLAERFKNAKGNFNERLKTFTAEERDKIILFDFFIQNRTPRIYEENNNGLNIADYRESFREKLAYGRAKDIYDYQKLDPINREYRTSNTYEFNDPTKNLFYSLNDSQKDTKLFDKQDKELKKGSVVEYNNEKYLFWNYTANDRAHLIKTDGTKFSGTPKTDKLNILGSYPTVLYNNTEYIVTDNNNIYSSATGKLVYNGNDDSSKMQKARILEQARYLKNPQEITKEENEFRKENISNPDIPLPMTTSLIEIENKASKQKIRESYDAEFDKFNRTSSIVDSNGKEIPITSEEKQFLADFIMIKISNIIDELLTENNSSDYFFDTYKDIDFTKKSREEILEIIPISEFFSAVRDIYFDDLENDREEGLSEEILEKKKFFYDNFNSLIILGKNKFQRLEKGNLVEKNATEGTENTTEFSSKEETSLESWMATHQISLHDSISNEFKRRFEKIFLSDEEGYYTGDGWGYELPISVSSGEIINSMLEWFDGTISIEEMEQELKNHDNIYWTRDILEMIKEEPLRSEFFTVMRKQKNYYTSIDNNGKIQYLNSQSKAKELLDEYIEEYLSIGEKIKQEDLNPKSIEEEKKPETLKEYLKALHLTFPSETLRMLETNEDYRIKLTKTLGNLIRHLQKSDIVDKLFTEELRNKNSKAANTTYRLFKDVFEIVAEVLPSNVDSSFYEDGKMYQTYDNPNYFGTMISRIKYLSRTNPEALKIYIENNFLQSKFFGTEDADGEFKFFNPILLYLYRNNAFFMRYFDKYNNLNSFDETFQDNPPLLEMMTKMIMYNNGGNKSVKYFATPVMGDKSANYFVGLPYLKDYNIIEESANIFNQELLRIKAVLERATQNNTNEIEKWDIPKTEKYAEIIKKIKNNELSLKDLASLQNTGASFYFLPFLNDLFLEENELGLLILDKILGREVDEIIFNELFERYITASFNEILDNEYNYMKSIGLFNYSTDSKGISNRTYLNKVFTQYSLEDLNSKSEESLKSLIKNFVFDSYFNTAYLTQLLITDLAFYGQATAVQKRISFVHSPRMVGNKYAVDSKNNRVSDGNFRYLIFEDSKIVSSIISNIEVALNQRIRETKESNPSLSTNIEILKESILNRFTKVVETDAQAYTSITGLRKKLIMLGKDNPALQEAYDRIKKGNYNIADITRFTNPQKPMVFSNNMVDTGSSFLGKVRKPTMIKDSEYLILLADALGQSVKGDNVNLLEIFTEIMEESADKFPTKGIDTITFPTAVKVGGKTPLKIEGKTKKEIKANIEKYIYLKDDKGNILDYNDNYVDTLDFDDWGLAQQVPYHFEDSQALEGSQLKALNIGDILPDTKFTIKETVSLNPNRNKTKEINGETFIQDYLQLLSNLTVEEVNSFKKEFKLDRSELEQRQALSKFLVQEIKKDAKYSYDLEWSVSLNEQGDFNVPLNDPTIKVKVTQLMNSVIKRAIHKQKVSGGPAVQVSSYGLSQNLNIRWKDVEGNLLLTQEEFEKKKDDITGYDTYKEYIEDNQGSIAYFECYVSCPWGQLAESMTNSDGSIMSIEEAIKKGLMTEEMRYMIGYRIPTENVYSMAPLYIKGFLPRGAGEGVMLPKEITTISGSDFDVDKLYLIVRELHFNQGVKNIENQIKGLISYLERSKNPKVNELITELQDRNKKYKLFNKIINSKKEIIEDTEVLEILDNWYNVSKQNLGLYLRPSLDKFHKATLQNKLFDYQWAYITNDSNSIKMFASGNFDSFKEVSKLVQDRRSQTTQNKENILLPSTNVKFHRQNMVGKEGIGISANDNVSHAFVSMLNLGYMNFTKDFKINNVDFKANTFTKYSSLVDIDGRLISANLAEFLAASVDAVKEPVLAVLNINSTTMSTALTMAKFGLSLKTIGLFMSNKILVDLINKFEEKNLEEYVTIETLIETWLKQAGFNEDDISTKLASSNITDEFLLDNLDTSDREKQAMILITFKNFYKAAKDSGELTNFTKLNSSSSAAGPDIADNIIKETRLRKFIEKMNTAEAPFKTYTENGIENIDLLDVENNKNPYLRTLYKSMYTMDGIIYKMFSPYFVEYTQSFINAKSSIEADSGLLLGKDEINNLVNWINLGMFLQQNSAILEKIENPITPLAKEFIENKFLERFSTIKKENPNNKFLNLFGIRYNKSLGSNMIIATSVPSLVTDKTDVINSWKDALTNSNDSMINLSNDLFIYQLLINGFNFSPKTALTLAPLEAKDNFNYFDALKPDGINNTIASLSATLFVRHNSYSPKVVKRFKAADLELNVKGKMPSTIIINSLSPQAQAKLESVERSDLRVKEYIRYVRIEDVLYRYNASTHTYKEISTLGVSNTFIEPYFSNPIEAKSAFKQSNKKIITPIKEEIPVTNSTKKSEIATINSLFATASVLNKNKTKEKLEEKLKENNIKTKNIEEMLELNKVCPSK